MGTEAMREVTIQIVYRLDGETADGEVREIEERLRRSAKRNLILKDETVSVAVIMDRRLVP